MSNPTDWKKEFDQNFPQIYNGSNVWLKADIEFFIEATLAQQRREVLVGYVSHETMASQVNCAVKDAYEEASWAAKKYCNHNRTLWFDKCPTCMIAQSIRALGDKNDNKG